MSCLGLGDGGFAGSSGHMFGFDRAAVVLLDFLQRTDFVSVSGARRPSVNSPAHVKKRDKFCFLVLVFGRSGSD